MNDLLSKIDALEAERGALKVRCNNRPCEWKGSSYESLRAPHPFKLGEEVEGCPSCKVIDSIAVVCETPDCWVSAAGHYDGRWACNKHGPNSAMADAQEAELNIMGEAFRNVEGKGPIIAICLLCSGDDKADEKAYWRAIRLGALNCGFWTIGASSKIDALETDWNYVTKKFPADTPIPDGHVVVIDAKTFLTK